MICFYYNVCDCHAFIKGNLLTYLIAFCQLCIINDYCIVLYRKLHVNTDA